MRHLLALALTGHGLPLLVALAFALVLAAGSTLFGPEEAAPERAEADEDDGEREAA